jgi:hypothetical protein
LHVRRFPRTDRWSGEDLHCRWKGTIVAIATRHADAVDIRFDVNGRPMWIALPCTAWVEQKKRTGKVITDQLAVQIAGRYLKQLIEEGYDSRREIYTMTVPEVLDHLDAVVAEAKETKKEDDRVMKETLKYSNQATAEKEEDKQNQELGDFMEAMMLANGRREQINGRSVLFYDILPNPRFAASNMDQRLAQVMQGKISIDEPTGEPVDINVKSVADWKIGWGLLANVHKGLWLHIHNHPEADGVWLTDFAEGSGDMRAALFLHPYIHFKEVTDNCRLYSATATQVGQPQVIKPH